MKQNKYLRYFIAEKHYLYLTLAILMAGIAVFEVVVLKDMQRRIVRLSTEKNTVKRLGPMEKKMKFYQKIDDLNMPPDSNQVDDVQGIVVSRDGVPNVLINNNVYREGDQLGEYTIIKITNDKTTLENQGTHEVRYLYLSK
jgi:hypothetical protein